MAKNDSFFNEIYGTYFNVVSSILRQAQEKQLTKDSLELLVREQAFADSCLTIPKSLQDGSWPLLQKDMTTPLRHAPAMPLTTLQRRWLKSLLTDKRLQLFDVDCSGLEDVEPLFSEEQFLYFDRYSDGDNYDDPQYKQHFRLLLQAITEKRRVEISFISGKNESVRKEYLPLQLEYSAKDDKFRLKAVCERYLHYVNVGRIKSCKMLEQTGEEACMLLEHAGLCGFREAVRVAVEAAFREHLAVVAEGTTDPVAKPADTALEDTLIAPLLERQLRDIGQCGLLDSAGGDKGRRLTVPERNCAGLIEQQDVDIAGCFNRFP